MARRALLDRIVYFLLKHQLVAVTEVAETLGKRPEAMEDLVEALGKRAYLHLGGPEIHQQQLLAKAIMAVRIILQVELMVAVVAEVLQRQAEMGQALLVDLAGTEQPILFQVRL